MFCLWLGKILQIKLHLSLPQRQTALFPRESNKHFKFGGQPQLFKAPCNLKQSYVSKKFNYKANVLDYPSPYSYTYPALLEMVGNQA